MTARERAAASRGSWHFETTESAARGAKPRGGRGTAPLLSWSGHPDLAARSDVIRDYAEARRYEIVRTYAGDDLKRLTSRPGTSISRPSGRGLGDS